MQLGKSLLGGIIGAAVGIGLLLAVYRLFGIDKYWLAIPFAIVTGVGVRMLVSTAGHASYVRGAITMVLALAGYIGGWYLVAQDANARVNVQVAKAPSSAEEKTADKTDEANSKDAETKDKAAPAAEVNAPVARLESSKPRAPGPQQFSTWNFIWLAVAALVAYQLGRGSEAAIRKADQPTEQVPADVHPDA
jgi:hypothetical protein